MLSSEYKILMKPARIYLIFCPKTHQRIYLSLIKIEKTLYDFYASCSVFDRTSSAQLSHQILLLKLRRTSSIEHTAGSVDPRSSRTADTVAAIEVTVKMELLILYRVM